MAVSSFITSIQEVPPGERPNTSFAAEDTAAQRVVSSLTTAVWWRAVAHNLVGRGLITCDGMRIERHNLTPKDRRRESSSNCSRCSISEAISRRVPSADELNVGGP
jgi:hypothetical protein